MSVLSLPRCAMAGPIWVGGAAVVGIALMAWAWYLATGVAQRFTMLEAQARQAVVDAGLSAEAARSAKTDFLANMSHEIRTPMNGVLGMAQILGETHLDGAQREYVGVIGGSAKALLSLINDLLDLSNIESKSLVLESVDFVLRDLIYETVTATTLSSVERGIELIVDVQATVPFVVRGDPGRLRQILISLLGNAVKFTHEGYVHIEVSSTVERGDLVLRIAVTDTGIGIPQDKLESLFKLFSQIDPSATRQYGGSGVGLSIVRRLVELMGGQVGVSSEEGRGSTFWFTLKSVAAPNQPRTEPLGLGRRVLVVDDIPAGRASLVTKLRYFSYEAVAAQSVEEALEILDRGERFDLVLADELMPKRGGLDLLTALRAHSRHAAMPFVLLSLFRTEAKHSGGLRPDGIVLKPVRATTLATLVDGIVSGKQPRVAMTGMPTPKSQALTGNRILVVDDNPVNQRIAERMLRKLEIDVVLADNGAEALLRLAESAFDAVLMDCQMPVMDGFTATRRFRETEIQKGGAHIPIIALTANNSHIDREACLAAGMDAHLSKPIDASRLAECLSQYLEPVMPPEVDLEAFRALTGGDAEFERDLVQTFVSSGDKCLGEIVAALAVRDFDTIGSRAHALKGASANIYAHRLNAVASRLETAARHKVSVDLDDLVRQLTTTLTAVNHELGQVG
jgi:signal transduction histidine kinase/CheY-like chemotaxis protein/HPt (histidine-containing phosphotransfer) domain-containing protein